MAAVLLAWLLPNRVPPWPAFYNEVLMPIALLPVGAWLLLRSATPVRLPIAALIVAMFASVPMLQWTTGQLRYAGDALLAALYLIGLSLCMVLGARWRDTAPADAARLVFTTLTLAALLSTHLGLLQWLRSDVLGVLLADLPVGGRPNANISQANHLASLLFLGLVSVWGLYLRADIRGGVALLAAAYLLFGMAMTQSRTGWLEVALLIAAAAIWRQRLRSRNCLPGLMALALLFAALVFFWPAINHALHLDGGLTLADQVHAGRRPAAWRAMFQALLAAPLWGYGWTQVVLAQQAVSHLEPALQVVFTYAHNLWLDLLIWNGIPLGLAAGALICGWFWQQLRRVQGQDETLLLLALLGLLLHAQFEFPYAYAYFLFPAGLIAGLLPSGGHCTVRRRPALVVAAAVALLPFLLAAEYMQAERAWLQVRIESARIRTHPDQAVAPLRWLDQIQGLVEQSRMDPKRQMTALQQAAFRTSVERFPASSSLYRLALMEAHHGRPDAATRALQALCSMHPPLACATAISVWRDAAVGDAALSLVRLPDPIV